MNLYRLDYLTDEGVIAQSVRTIGMDYLSRSAANARRYGIAAARQSGRNVLMSQIGKHGQVKPYRFINAETGTVHLPR